MTRNDYKKIIKSLLIGMVCGLPIVILLSILLATHVSSAVLTIINIAVLIITGVCGYFMGLWKAERIKKKREEYLRNEQKTKAANTSKTAKIANNTNPTNTPNVIKTTNTTNITNTKEE